MKKKLALPLILFVSFSLNAKIDIGLGDSVSLNRKTFACADKNLLYKYYSYSLSADKEDMTKLFNALIEKKKCILLKSGEGTFIISGLSMPRTKDGDFNEATFVAEIYSDKEQETKSPLFVLGSDISTN